MYEYYYSLQIKMGFKNKKRTKKKTLPGRGNKLLPSSCLATGEKNAQIH
jgi:hypothetical protein